MQNIMRKIHGKILPSFLGSLPVSMELGGFKEILKRGRPTQFEFFRRQSIFLKLLDFSLNS
jgi:hypothetical protein